MGTADEEVSPKRCERFVAASRAKGGDIAITLYAGATHGFDDPGAKRQKLEERGGNGGCGGKSRAIDVGAPGQALITL
jgi:dienelactone hydrolase